MKSLPFLTFLTVTSAALAQPAQTGIEKATFGMAKATLEFLATDTKTFPGAKETSCKNCVEYGDLSAFIQKNSLKKADGLVDDIKKQSLKLNDAFAADAFTSEGAMLDSLQRYIVNRVTGGPERAHRKQLASFATYETKMVDLAGGDDAGQADSEQTAALQDGSAPTDEPAGSTSGFAWGTWAFWLTLLNLAGLVYLLLTRRQATQGSAPKVVQQDQDEARIAALQDENKHLTSATTELSGRLAVIEKKLAALTNSSAAPNATTAPSRPNPAPQSPTGSSGQTGGNVPRDAAPQQLRPNPASENQPNPSAMPMSGMSQMGAPGQQPTQMQPSAVRPTPNVTPPPSEINRPMSGGDALGNAPVGLPTSNRPAGGELPASPAAGSPMGNRPSSSAAAPTRFFARTADMGNGFSVGGLLKEPERGTVYDIELTSPTTATFRVSQSTDAQQLAMSDPYSYLSDACLYENQPGGTGSRIHTVAAGQLVLQADKWQITEKARIGFA